MNIKIGDKIEYEFFPGATGIVLAVKEDDKSSYGVEFDNNIDGHSLRGLCEAGHGWWCREEYITKIPDIEIPKEIFEEMFEWGVLNGISDR